MNVTETARLIRGLVIATEKSRAQTARSLGHSSNEVAALLLVGVDGPITPNDLATRLTLTTGSVTALLDRLQDANLVRRDPNPDDRRSILVSPTESGTKMVESMIDSFDRVVHNAAKSAAVKDIRAVNDLLRGLITGIDDSLAENES